MCPGRGSGAPASGGDSGSREGARAAPGSGGVCGDRGGGAWPGSRGPLRGPCDTPERIVALWRVPEPSGDLCRGGGRGGLAGGDFGSLLTVYPPLRPSG